jgi:hypothetical protein
LTTVSSQNLAPRDETVDTDQREHDMIMVGYQRGNMHFSRELGGTLSALHRKIGFDPIPRSARRGDVMDGGKVRFYRSSTIVCMLRCIRSGRGKTTLAYGRGTAVFTAMLRCSAQDTEKRQGCFNQPPSAEGHSGRVLLLGGTKYR